MRDYTVNDYFEHFWISDILALKKKSNKGYVGLLRRSNKCKPVAVSTVIIFGTIVETKQIGDTTILYYIDDGTGTIACAYNDLIFKDIVDTIQLEQSRVLNETFTIKYENENESLLNNTVSDDDTIFNDNTLQEEEALAIKRNKLKALHSIWADIEDSFSAMTRPLEVGDSVLVHGRVYDYIHVNQIHVNSIRQINTKEEIILTKIKLEDGCEASKEQKMEIMEITHNVELIENKRRSGLMTFDHIQHSDLNELPVSKIILSKRDSIKEKDKSRKRKSIIPPHLQGTMTFDTFTNFDDSGCKSPKLEV